MGYITKEDKRYPDRLKEIYDPPEKLYFKGDPFLLSGRTVAIVGSRQATGYGLRVAGRIAKVLGDAGIHIVSGMAYGIDMAAHRGAVDTAGGTIAVLGSSIDMESSYGRREMFEDIKERGLVLSEYPPGTAAAPYSFPRRNRIISGLAEAVIVVEGSFNSGSLITAELAQEQGRTVFAVPGNIDSPQSLGPNMLIADGALPLTSIGDLLSYLGIERDLTGELSGDEARIYRIISSAPEVTLDRIRELTGLPKKTVAGIVSVMEIKGYCVTSMGRVSVPYTEI